MQKIWLTMICAGLLLSPSLGTLAQDKAVPQEKTAGKPQKAWSQKQQGSEFKELGLTEDQQKKMREIRESQRTKMQSLLKELQSKHAELKSLLDKPETSRADVAALVKQIKDLQNKKLDQRIEAVFAAKAILTPEQYIKFTRLIEEHRKKKFKRPGSDGNE